MKRLKEILMPGNTNLDSQNNFDPLIKELSDTERRKLLEKISTRLDSKVLNENYEESVKSETTAFSKQDGYLENRLNSLGFIDRIIIWFKSLFSGRNEKIIVLDIELSHLKRKINSVNSGIVDFENGVLTHRFAQVFLPLISQLSDNLSRFERFMLDPVYYYGFLSYAFEKRFDEKQKNDLEDLTPTTIAFSENKESYIEDQVFYSELERRQKKFFLGLNSSAFTVISEQINLFDRFLLLLKTDFKPFFVEFKIINNTDVINVSNFGEFKKLVGVLERFTSILNSFPESISQVDYIKYLPEYSKENPIIMVNDSIDIFTEYDLKVVEEIISSMSQIGKQIPFTDIFKYFKKNLFYTPKTINIKYDFTSSYKDYKKNVTDFLWKKFYADFKKELYYKMVDKVLPGYRFSCLRYFNGSLRNMLDPELKPLLLNTAHLNLGYKFHEEIYTKFMEPLVHRLLIDGSFYDNNEREKLSTVYYKLKEISKKIKEFDELMSESGELGKKFRLYQRRASADEYYRQSLKNSIIEINGKSNEIVDELIQSYDDVNRFIVQFEVPIPGKGFPITNLDDIKPLSGLHVYLSIEKALKYFENFYSIYRISETIQ